MLDHLLHNLEWLDWVVMFFLFIPSVIGVIFGSVLTLLRMQNESSQKLVHTARALDVRLSMHPGQFTVLASDNADIVDRSIEEFEYHTDVIRYMGYGQTFQDFKCNVHISGRQGPAGIRSALKRLSPEARNAITIENDENKWGIADSLELADDLALVLDIHHHWCREGEYIKPTDDRFARVIDSWRGVRPAIHYSYSRTEHLPEGYAHDTLPRHAGAIRSRLQERQATWRTVIGILMIVVNDWALSFLALRRYYVRVKVQELSQH